MIESLGGVTSELAALALDAALLRHEVSANNIANADTPGYIPKRVKFEEYLARYISSSGEIDKPALARDMGSIENMVQQGHAVVESGSDKVELDKEMIEVTQNVLRYQALLSAMSKRGALVDMAIKGGRS